MSCRAVVLVGLRGVGKTTVGCALAARLGWSFVDSDDRIAAEVGRPAGVWLAEVGEGEFRRREAAVVAPLLAAARQSVIATGGGAVTIAAVRNALADPALLVVWLTASDTTLLARMAAADVVRPALTAGPPAAELEALHRQRDAHYALVARFVIDTGIDGIEAVTAALAGAAVQGRRPGPGSVAGFHPGR